MQRNALIPEIHSSFLSCEKDTEKILTKLFKESQPYSNYLKKLLVINNPNCLDSKEYDAIVEEYSVHKLMNEKYIRLVPKLELAEHEPLKSYILITFDNFTTNEVNERFRDCTVHIDIMCHTDCWQLSNFKIRPLMIAGYIDGILNFSKLSGVGEFVFLGCQELILDEKLAGYTLSYRAVHFTEDDAKLSEIMS